MDAMMPDLHKADVQPVHADRLGAECAHIIGGLLTPEQITKLLGLGLRTLERLWTKRQGPPRMRIGHKTFVRTEALLDWLRSREV